MKVGDKYLIEIAEVIKTQQGDLARIKGFDSLVMSEYGLDKLSYVEEIAPSKPEAKVGSVIKFDYDGDTRYGVVTYAGVSNLDLIMDDGAIFALSRKEVVVVGQIDSEFFNMMASMKVVINQQKGEA